MAKSKAKNKQCQNTKIHFISGQSAASAKVQGGRWGAQKSQWASALLCRGTPIISQVSRWASDWLAPLKARHYIAFVIDSVDNTRNADDDDEGIEFGAICCLLTWFHYCCNFWKKKPSLAIIENFLLTAQDNDHEKV